MKYIVLIVLIIFSVTFAQSGLQISSGMLTFPEPGIEDLDAGYLDYDRIAKSNRVQLLINVPQDKRWNVYLISAQPALYSGQYGLPVEKLLFKLALQPVTAYRPVTLNRTLIMSGSGVHTLELNFRLLMDWNTRPGYYNIELQYELEIINE